MANTVSSLLGSNNDYTWINGRRAMVTGANLIRQRWGVKAQSIKGDYVINRDDGLPYFDEILTKSITKTRMREIFRDMSLNTEGVLSVISIQPGSVDPKTRKLTSMVVKCLIVGDEGAAEYATFRFSDDIYDIGIPGNIETIIPPDYTIVPVAFTHVRRDGGPLWTDYAVFYAGGGISLGDGAHGISITNTGVRSIEAAGASSSLAGDVVLGAGDGISLVQTTQIDIENTGLLSLSSDSEDQRLAGHLRIVSGTNIVIDKLADDTGYQISAILADAVTSFGEQGGAAQVGDITISEGANITITRTGTNFEIASTASGGVTDHGALTGLTDVADHPYAFLHDGTRVATGGFNMDNHAIGDASLIGWHLNGTTPSEGEMCWDSDNGTLALGMPGGNVVMQVGQELPFRSWNQSGINLLNGNACRISGATGNLPNISIAGIVSAVGGNVFGLCTEAINNGSSGYVTALGIVNGLNTSVFSSGDELWLTSAGQWTVTQPSAPYNSTKIGFVIQSHATEGSIYVRPHRIPRYNDLQDVNVRNQTLYNGNITAWNGTSEYWDVLSDFFIRYDGSDYVIETDVGTLVFDDEYRATSTTFTSRLKMASSQAEWDALGTSLGGPQSLVYILNQALSGGGGTLDNAYDYGGAGAGAGITADTGAVTIQNNGENSALELLQTASSPTATYVQKIQNNDTGSTCDGILFSGLAGASSTGHRIWSYDGAVSLGSTYTTEGDGYIGVRVPTTYVQVEMQIPDTAAIYINGLGDAHISATDEVFVVAVNGVDIDAPIVDLNDSVVEFDMHTASYASGTVTADFSSSGGKHNYVAITGNVTTFTITSPGTTSGKTVDGLKLEIFASGGSYTITGFSGFMWFGSYNPDSVPYTIPAGERVTIMAYYTSTSGYRAQLIPMA